MVKIGDKITIKFSPELERRGHGALVGKSGVVTKLLVSNGAMIGAFIDIKIMRRVRNLFIPACSIEGAFEINKARALSILKTTIL